MIAIYLLSTRLDLQKLFLNAERLELVTPRPYGSSILFGSFTLFHSQKLSIRHDILTLLRIMLVVFTCNLTNHSDRSPNQQKPWY